VRLALPCGGVQAGGAAPRQRWKGQKQNYPGKPCGEHPGRSLPRSGKKVRVLRPLSAGVAHRCERAAAVSPPAILRASAAASELGRRVGIGALFLGKSGAAVSPPATLRASAA
jgi:hypothetical protein